MKNAGVQVVTLEKGTIHVDQRLNGMICGTEAAFTFDAAIAEQATEQVSEMYAYIHGLASTCAILVQAQPGESERGGMSQGTVRACSTVDNLVTVATAMCRLLQSH